MSGSMLTTLVVITSAAVNMIQSPRSERRLSSERPSPVLLGGRQEFFQNRLDRNADRVQPSHKPARPDPARWVAHNARDAGRLDPILKRDLAREGEELDRGSFDPARLALGSD